MCNRFYAIMIDGQILPSTIQYLRRDAVSSLLKGSQLTWGYFKKQGYKVVKIIVMPVDRW